MKFKRFALLVLCGLLLSTFFCALHVSADNVRILCIGDSITCGSGSANNKERPGSINESLNYPGQLKTLLGSGYTLVNYGVSGASVMPDPRSGQPTPQGAVKNAKFIKSFQENDADIVLIMMGTNDSKLTVNGVPGVWDAQTGGAENFSWMFYELVQKYKQMPSSPDVYILIPPPTLNEGENGGCYRINNRVLRDEIQPIQRQVAAQLGCGVIDLRALFPNPSVPDGLTEMKKLLVDGVHPNSTGYAIIANAIKQVISTATPRPSPSQNNPPSSPTQNTPSQPEPSPSQPVTPPPTFRVSYDWNGGYEGAAPVDETRYESLSFVSLMGADGVTRDGYRFLGWCTSPQGEAAIYAPGSEYLLEGADTTFYAIWEKIVYYRLSYDTTVEGVRGLPHDDTLYESGSTVEIPLPTDIESDYDKFLGWSLTENGPLLTEKSITFTDHDITLFAVMEETPFTPLVPQSPMFLIFWIVGGAVFLAVSFFVFVVLIRRRRKKHETE